MTPYTKYIFSLSNGTQHTISNVNNTKLIQLISLVENYKGLRVVHVRGEQ